MICPLALRIQAQLVDLDRQVREVDNEQRVRTRSSTGASVSGSSSSGQPGQAIAENLTTTMQCLVELFDEATRHDHDVVTSVPDWLGPDSEVGGLGLLLVRLTEPRPSDEANSLWSQTCVFLYEDWGWLAEALASTWITLQATGPARTYIGSACSNNVSENREAEGGGHRGSSEAEFPENTDPLVAAEPGQHREAPHTAVIVPVVHETTGHGLLVMLSLGTISSRGSEPDRAWTSDFEEAVLRGRDTATELCREMGLRAETVEPWNKLVPLKVDGLPAGYQLQDGSAAIPAALAVLSALLDLPAADVVTTGGIDQFGSLAQSPEDVFRAKAEAARTAGLTLRQLGATTLSEAGAEVWTLEWQQARSAAATAGLEAAGAVARVVEDLGLEQTGNGDFVELAPTTTGRRLAECVESGERACIIGGSVASGRSTEARRLGLSWVSANSGTVVEIHTDQGRLPNPGSMRRIVSLVRPALGLDDQPVAVILEDLVPRDSDVDLDESLLAAADDHTLLIAVCLYMGGTGWTCEQVVNTPTPRGREQLMEFANAFLESNNRICEPEVMALCLRESHGDTWLFTHLLLETSSPASAAVVPPDRVAAKLAPPAPTTTPPRIASPRVISELSDEPPLARINTVLETYAARWQEGLSGQELRDARALAAASLLGIGIPRTMLRNLSDTKLRRLGATRDYRRRWYLRRGVTCRALLHGSHQATQGPVVGPRWLHVAEDQFSALSTFLKPLMREPNQEVLRLTSALLSASDAAEHRLHRRLVSLTTEMFTDHLKPTSHPAVIAFALLGGGSQLEHQARKDLFSTLVKALNTQGWQHLNLRYATTCLHALRVNRDLLNDRRSDPDRHLVQSDYDDVLISVHTQVLKALAASDPTQGMLLVRELGMFFEEAAGRDLVKLAAAATNQSQPDRIDDYSAVVRLVDYALRYGWDRPHRTLEVLRGSEGIKRLLAHVEHVDAGTRIAQCALEAQLTPITDPYAHFRRIGIEISGTLRHSDPRFISQGLQLLLEIDRGHARTLVSSARIDDWLRRDVWTTSTQVPPFVSSQLMRTVTKASNDVLYGALYDAEGAAREEVLDSLFESITSHGDLKAVGHILSASAAGDELFGPGGETFTSDLTARLQAMVSNALSSELRSSVILHTVTALIAANCPTENLRALLGRCARVVGTEARDNDKDNAPRLALLLAAHPDVGAEFLALLDVEIDDDILLQRAFKSQAVASRAAYIELASALDRAGNRDFVDNFVGDRWLKNSLSKLQSSDALTALLALKAYAQFLLEAGLDVDMQALLDEVQPNGDWGTRLRHVHHPSQLAEALGLLRKMAHPVALKAIQRLDELHVPSNWLSTRSRPGQGPERSAPMTPRSATAIPRQRGNSDNLTTDQRSRTGDTATPAPSPATVARVVRNRTTKSPGLGRLVQRQFVQPSQALELVHCIQKIDPDRARGIAVEVVDQDSWNARVRAILDTDSPIQIGQSLVKMSRAELWLEEVQLRRLSQEWIPQASRIRSPRAAHSMTRGLAAATRGSDQELGILWANSLNLESIGTRLARRSRTDADDASALIDSLALWGPEDSASFIAQCVPTDAVRLLEPRRAFGLLTALRGCAPDVASTHVDAALADLTDRATRRFLPNRIDHWVGLGWYAKALRAAAPSTRFSIAVHDAADAIAHEPTRNWVQTAFGASADLKWLDTDIEERSRWSVSERATRLVAIAQEGLTGRYDRDELAADVVAVTRSRSLLWIGEVLRAAQVHDSYRSAFNPSFQSELRDFTDRELSLGSTAAVEVAVLLDNLTGARSA